MGGERQESLYHQVGRLLETFPDFTNELNDTASQWMGRASVLVRAVLNPMQTVEFDQKINTLTIYAGSTYDKASYEIKFATNKIRTLLYQALAELELQLPDDKQGLFVHEGGDFSAFTAIGKILNSARSDILIIDPYLDEVILSDFALQVPEHITLKLLTGRSKHKSSLKPATIRWNSEYGSARPLEVRIAEDRLLHDRLIIRDGEIWILTQSFKDFAKRSPASLVRFFGESEDKMDAYNSIWNSATDLIE